MRLLILTYGSYNHSSSRIRALQYIPSLKKSGFDKITWIPRVMKMPKFFLGRYIVFPLAKKYFLAKTFFYLYFGNFDAIYIQRHFIKNVFLLNRIQKKNIPIIFDFDDAIYIDKKGEQKNLNATVLMLKYAKKVIVSSEILIPFCNQYNVNPTVITTPVDLQKIRNIKNSSQFTVGWIGSYSTGKYIFTLNEIIKKTASEKNIFWKIMGYKGIFGNDEKRIQFKNWSIENENNFLKSIEIGVMPLPDDDWARAKGGYKLLLYMSYGIPVIASPIGINKEIVEDGENGFLVTTDEEWMARIYQLQEDENLWKSMSEKAYKTIEKKYSREICYEKLDICIQQALKK